MNEAPAERPRPCRPCIARERARTEESIIDQTAMSSRIGAEFASEFRRLVSIAPQLDFREQLAALEEFNTATDERQWALLLRYAEDHREGMVEEFTAVTEELDDMQTLIAAARSELAPPPVAEPTQQAVAVVQRLIS